MLTPDGPPPPLSLCATKHTSNSGSGPHFESLPGPVQLYHSRNRSRLGYVTGTTHSFLPGAHGAPHFQYLWQLYHGSHSLVVVAVVFGLVWAICGRPVLEMSGWALHILMDIHTHHGIFAVHFLWPLSNYGFNGIRWENHWFLTLNYTTLLAVLGWLWIRPKQGRHRPIASGL